MRSFKNPGSIILAFPIQHVQSCSESFVIPVTESRDYIEPDQKIIVVMIWIVETEPWKILLTLVEQSSIKIKFGASLNRILDFSCSPPITLGGPRSVVAAIPMDTARSRRSATLHAQRYWVFHMASSFLGSLDYQGNFPLDGTVLKLFQDGLDIAVEDLFEFLGQLAGHHDVAIPQNIAHVSQAAS